MDREEYRQLRDMITEALDTNRPIERNFSGKWAPLDVLGVSVAQLRVQPAPPQPKFRPMNHEELMNEVYKKTVVGGPTSAGHKAVGVMSFFNGNFEVSGTQMDTAMLRYADPSDPRYGQLLQVEIKDAPQ